jgi:hypothetical protein
MQTMHLENSINDFHFCKLKFHARVVNLAGKLKPLTNMI